MMPPRFILRATIAQMQQFIARRRRRTRSSRRSPIAWPQASGIPRRKREELRAAAERITAAQVYPAWRNGDCGPRPLAGRATDDAGLWRFKGGAEAYAYFLRRFTTTTLTADEIHQIGLREVARLEKEMDAILRQARADRKDRSATASRSSRRTWPIRSPRRAARAIMADIERIMRDAEQPRR